MNTHRVALTATLLLACLGGAGLTVLYAGGDKPPQAEPPKSPPAARPDAPRPDEQTRPAEGPAAAGKGAQRLTARELHAALQAPLDPMIDQATELPLSSWLEMFKKSGVPVFVDEESFMRDAPIRAYGDESPRVKIRAMPNATVEQVLRAVLAPLSSGDPDVPGRISVRVQDGMVRLIRGPAEWRVKPDEGDIVTLHVEEKPLAEVLQLLAGRTGANIVLDVRAKDKARTVVSATFSDVRVMPALRVLCDMCDLQPVSLNNVFYVTSRENAARLLKEIDGGRSAGLSSLPAPAPGVPQPPKTGGEPATSPPSPKSMTDPMEKLVPKM